MKKFTCILLAAVMLSSVTFGQKYGPTTTLTVAAVDSSKQAIANSDFQCSGHSDDVIIQRAINRYATTGGKVELLAGTYRLSATVNLVAGVTVSGAGYATNIVAPSGAAAFTVNDKDNATIADLRITGVTTGTSAVDVDDSDNFAVRNVYFADVDTAAVNADTVNGLLVTGCYAPAGVNLVTTASCNGVVEAVNASRNVLASAAAGWSNCYIVSPNESLATAYDWLKSSDRDAVMGALSKTNRRTLALLPGTYTLTETLELDTPYVDLVGMASSREQVVVTSAIEAVYTLLDPNDAFSGSYTSGGTIFQSADGVVLSNFTIRNTNTTNGCALAIGDLSASGTGMIIASQMTTPTSATLEAGDCIKVGTEWFDVLALQSATTTTYVWTLSGSPALTGSHTYTVARRGNRYVDMAFLISETSVASVVVNATVGCGVQGGTWINCIGGPRSYRLDANAEDHSLMINCVGGAYSFFGDYTGISVSGKYLNCVGANYCFGGCNVYGANITAYALFKNCVAHNKSFGMGKTVAGTFIDCLGGDACFGGYSGSGTHFTTFSGTAINCKATGLSFGAAGDPNSVLSGSLIGCELTGLTKTLYCKGAVIDRSIITVTGGTNVNALTLTDDDTQIYNSRIFVLSSGSGLPVASDGSARNVVVANCVMNNSDNDADGIGADVTNGGGNNHVLGNVD